MQLNVSDGVGISDYWGGGWVQLRITLLKLFELLKLFICWQREHVNNRFNLLGNLRWVVCVWVNHHILRLFRLHHVGAMGPCLTIWCPLILKFDGSIGPVIHRICFLAVFIAAWFMHVKVGSSGQAATLHFGAEEFTNWVLSELLNSQLASEHIWVISILLVDLRKGVRHHQHLRVNGLILCRRRVLTYGWLS